VLGVWVGYGHTHLLHRVGVDESKRGSFRGIAVALLRSVSVHLPNSACITPCEILAGKQRAAGVTPAPWTLVYFSGNTRHTYHIQSRFSLVSCVCGRKEQSCVGNTALPPLYTRNCHFTILECPFELFF